MRTPSLFSNLIRCFFAKIALISLLSGCAAKHIETVNAQNPSSVLYWSDHALALIKKYQLNPLRAARVLAYTHDALEQNTAALNARDHQSMCNSYANDLVASKILEHFFPEEVEGKILALAAIRAPQQAIQANCTQQLNNAEKIVDATIQKVMRDGAFPPRRLAQNPVARDGQWRATAPLFVVYPLEAFANSWTTMFKHDLSKLTIAPRVSAGTNEYKEALEEVLAVQQSLTPQQIDIANFWHLEAGSVTPAGVWNMKLRELLETSNFSEREISRLYAVMNMAMFDAFVACWHVKYTYWTERPITAAERYGKTFVPLLITPPFPSYPSGHACASGAASAVISAYMPQKRQLAERWAEEAANSRLLGGIHFRYDNSAGLTLGRKVGLTAVSEMPPHN